MCFTVGIICTNILFQSTVTVDRCLDGVTVWCWPGMKRLGSISHYSIEFFCPPKPIASLGAQLQDLLTYCLKRTSFPQLWRLNVKVDSCLDHLAVWCLPRMREIGGWLPIEAYNFSLSHCYNTLQTWSRSTNKSMFFWKYKRRVNNLLLNIYVFSKSHFNRYLS